MSLRVLAPSCLHLRKSQKSGCNWGMTSDIFVLVVQHGGNGTILADRFLYEVAFKLWKAPKYGA